METSKLNEDTAPLHAEVEALKASNRQLIWERDCLAESGDKATQRNVAYEAEVEALKKERDLLEKLRASEAQAKRERGDMLADLTELVGEPPTGSHPDEQRPRAATWHQERLNWISEVETIRTENASLRKQVTAAEGLETALTALKAACVEVLLPSINEAVDAGYKMETWVPEQFQFSKAVEMTESALTAFTEAKR